MLVVEDDASVRGALGAHLVRAGFSVVGVASTAEALRELANPRRAYDAILTDCGMPPGPDGIELAREARLPGTGLIPPLGKLT